MLTNTWQPFVKLVRGMYCVSYLRFFCLLWLLARALPPLYSLVLVITQNVPRYLHFGSCSDATQI